ncbi:MAG: zinc-ribbon domain-containing protein [Clostridiales bacterium]|nr:zinc-ribbon domain-containing protein [Clostridiales bacterium]
MFCNNCGTQFDDTESFCPNCGTPAQQTEQAAPEEATAPAKNASNDIKEKLPLLIGAAAAVIVVILILSALFGGSAKSTIKKYYKAVGKGDQKTISKLMAPEKVREEQVDDAFDCSLKEYYKVYNKAWEALYKGLKKEGKVKFEYEIKNIEDIEKLDKLEDEVGKIDDLDEFKDMLDDVYDDYDFDYKKIKTCKVAEVKYVLNVDGKKAAKGTYVTFVYKYKGDWYVYCGPGLNSILNQLSKSDDADDYEDAVEDARDALEDLD